MPSCPPIPGKAGIWVKHLTTGEDGRVRADEIFNSASVIKIPVLVLAFQMADKGAINLDERMTIREEDIRGGSGIFRYHDAGLQPTFRDVLLQMVITSDNTATDLAIAKVGGVARVNAWLKEAGYADGRRWCRPPASCSRNTTRSAPADDRNAKTNSDRSYWLGEITPRGVGLMLEAIEKKTHRLEGRLRRDAAHDARAAGRRAPAAALHLACRSRTRPATSRRCWPTTSASSTRDPGRSSCPSSATPSPATTAKPKIGSAVSRSNIVEYFDK